VSSARLEPPADGQLTSGPGNAFLVLGTAAAGERPRVELGPLAARLLADRVPVEGSEERGGFWGIVELPAGVAGRYALTVGPELAEEVEVSAAIDTDSTPAGARIAIAMATYEPPIELFRAQIESIRSQTVGDWVCVISDDASSQERFGEMREVIGDDDRFVVSRSPARLGFYRNFERALTAVPSDAELVALCDQDDVWHPDKLERLAEAIGSAVLVYSDVRIVDPAGAVVSPTFWVGRRNNSTNLASLLFANTVTGAASLFRRDLLDDALPLPSAPGPVYHDHWIALIALARGEIRYLDQPLYDYVQHERAFLGHTAAQALDLEPRPVLARLRGGPERYQRMLTAWRRYYFEEYCRTQILARVLRLRLSRRIPLRKRAMLGLFVDAERSPFAWAWLLARSFRTLFGRNETLAVERGLLRGILWRRLLPFAGRHRRFPATPRSLTGEPAPLRSPSRRD
jgi:glycosyltransferase involved in cell wall biosynthesis